MKLLVAIALSSSAASAQAIPPPTDNLIRGGPRLAISMAKLGGDGVGGGVSTRTGLHAGGFLLVGPSPYFAIESGLFYAQKGASLGTVFDHGSVTLDYVQLALLAVPRVPVGGNARACALLGGTVNRNIKAEQTVDGVYEDLDGKIRKIDFDLLFGLGLEVVTTYGVVVFDVRYEYGLETIDVSEDPDDVRHRVLTIGGGFGF